MISYVICLSQKVDFFNLSSHTLGADLGEGLQIAFLKTSSENSVQPAQLLPPRCRRNAVVAMLSSCCGPVHPASRPPCQLWNHSDFYYPLQILLFIQMPFFSPFFPQLLSPSLIFFIFSIFFFFYHLVFTGNTFFLELYFLLSPCYTWINLQEWGWGWFFWGDSSVPHGSCLHDSSASLQLFSCCTVVCCVCLSSARIQAPWEGISAFSMTLLELSIMIGTERCQKYLFRLKCDV